MRRCRRSSAGVLRDASKARRYEPLLACARQKATWTPRAQRRIMRAEGRRTRGPLAKPKDGGGHLAMTQQHVSQSPRGSTADSPSAAAPQDAPSDLAAEVEALSRLNDASSRLWHVSSLEDALKE